MMVVGGIIGSGIFLNPAVVATRAGTGPLTIGAWLLGGVIAVLGAFIYAEARGPDAPLRAAGTSTCARRLGHCRRISTPGPSCSSSHQAPLPRWR